MWLCIALETKTVSKKEHALYSLFLKVNKKHFAQVKKEERLQNNRSKSGLLV
jgi:CRISPR/Cas system CMR-associated protein Cmr3 (group 5 of RAMP superfamily)